MIVTKNALVAAEVNYSQPHLEIESSGGEYVIYKRNASAGPPAAITASDLEPWGRKVYYWSDYGDGFVSPPHYEDSRDADGFLRSRFGVTGVDFVAARGGNDELVIVTLLPTKTSLPASVHSIPGPVIEAVAAVLPGFDTSQRAISNKAKRDLLLQVNPMDILSEQEKQLDLMSALVIDLAERLPVADRPSWLTAFKAVIDQHSAVQFKGPAGCIADIEERKSNVRSLQQAYFAQRDGLNA